MSSIPHFPSVFHPSKALSESQEQREEISQYKQKTTRAVQGGMQMQSLLQEESVAKGAGSDSAFDRRVFHYSPKAEDAAAVR